MTRDSLPHCLPEFHHWEDTMGRRRNGAGAGAAIGHNSNINDAEKKKLGGYIQEIERVDAEVRELTSERGNIYKSAKEAGFDTKALKRVIVLRRMEKSKREEHEAAVDAYMVAMGDFASTPLGQAAMPASDRV
jgi:uncharacterized protein (UPF0335 family)